MWMLNDALVDGLNIAEWVRLLTGELSIQCISQPRVLAICIVPLICLYDCQCPCFTLCYMGIDIHSYHQLLFDAYSSRLTSIPGLESSSSHTVRGLCLNSLRQSPSPFRRISTPLCSFSTSHLASQLQNICFGTSIRGFIHSRIFRLTK
jgi:hypothetical protein